MHETYTAQPWIKTWVCTLLLLATTALIGCGDESSTSPEPAAEPAVEPAAQPVVEPVVEPAVEPENTEPSPAEPEAMEPEAKEPEAMEPEAMEPEPEVPRPVQMCPELEPCGGDVVGVWVWESWCQEVAEEPFLESCPVSGIVQSIVPEGTLEFRDDGTFVVEATYRPTARATVPLLCLAEQGCDGFQQMLLQEEEDDNAAWSCTEEEASCVCTRTEEGIDGNDRGTWSTDGNTLLSLPEGDEELPLAFCVEGDALMLLDVGAPPTDPLFGLVRP